MPTAKTMIHVRVADDLKEQVSTTLASMGLSVSEAVRLFLHRVVAEQKFPFELRVPNVETRLAMSEADEIIKSHQSRFSNSKALIDGLEAHSE